MKKKAEQFRKAQYKDVDNILELHNELSPKLSRDRKVLVRAINFPCTEVYVLIIDGEIIGTGTISHRIVPDSGFVGFIDSVVVSGEHRGKGLGIFITEKLLAIARARQYIRVELTSNPARIAANALYKKMGFTKRATNALVYHLEE